MFQFFALELKAFCKKIMRWL